VTDRCCAKSEPAAGTRESSNLTLGSLVALCALISITHRQGDSALNETTSSIEEATVPALTVVGPRGSSASFAYSVSNST
jgi:hypothetical protein